MLYIFPYVFLILILAIVTITDLREKRIPNVAILLAILVKLVHSFIASVLEEVSFLEVLLGLFIDGLLVSLPLLIIVLFIEKVLKKEALGGGDIKLVFVTGLYLGWERNLWMLLLASVLGVVVGFLKLRKSNRSEDEVFPFGPMIGIATIIFVLIDLFGI